MRFQKDYEQIRTDNHFSTKAFSFIFLLAFHFKIFHSMELLFFENILSIAPGNWQRVVDSTPTPRFIQKNILNVEEFCMVCSCTLGPNIPFHGVKQYSEGSKRPTTWRFRSPKLEMYVVFSFVVRSTFLRLIYTNIFVCGFYCAPDNRPTDSSRRVTIFLGRFVFSVFTCVFSIDSHSEKFRFFNDVLFITFANGLLFI